MAVTIREKKEIYIDIEKHHSEAVNEFIREVLRKKGVDYEELVNIIRAYPNSLITPEHLKNIIENIIEDYEKDVTKRYLIESLYIYKKFIKEKILPIIKEIKKYGEIRRLFKELDVDIIE